MSLRFEVTFHVDLDLSEPFTIQELARIEEVVGVDGVAALIDPEAPITPLQTRAALWSKLVTQYPTIELDQFDSLEEVPVG